MGLKSLGIEKFHPTKTDKPIVSHLLNHMILICYLKIIKMMATYRPKGVRFSHPFLTALFIFSHNPINMVQPIADSKQQELMFLNR